jgi:hypothetical protein
MLSTFCRVMPPVAKVQQGAQVTISLEDDVSPLAAISSVRTTFRDELLPSEAHAATPAIASPHKNFRFIDEH